MITRKYIIKLIEDYTYSELKINQVGLLTLRQIRKTKIIILNDKTYQHKFQLSDCAAFCLNKSTFVINKDKIIDDLTLIKVCVHEINHLINWDLKTSEAYKEFIAFVAEKMFIDNVIHLSVKDINVIKDKIARLYIQIPVNEIRVIKDYSKGVLYSKGN